MMWGFFSVDFLKSTNGEPTTMTALDVMVKSKVDEIRHPL